MWKTKSKDSTQNNQQEKIIWLGVIVIFMTESCVVLVD